MRFIKSLWRLPVYVQYAVPLLGACIIVYLRSRVSAFDSEPFALTGAVVTLSALIGGIGPGAVGCALMIVLGISYQLQLAHGVLTPAGTINLVAMSLVLITVTIVVHAMRLVIQAHEGTMARFNRERDKLAFLLDSLQHGFIIVDRSWCLTFANKAALEMSGLSVEQLTGESLWDLIGGELHGFQGGVESARAEGLEVRQELTIGGRIYDVRAIPHENETLIYAQDLTERRRIESQRSALLELERDARRRAESAVHEKDDFLLTISHELRTPLTTIIGWLEIMDSDSRPPTLARGRDAIRRSAHAQEQMVGQLLDLASIRNGRLSLPNDVFELEEAVAFAVTALKADCKERQHVLEVSTAPIPMLVRGDQDQVAKAIQIILDNALRYTPSPGRICLTAGPVASMAVVEIEDNGKGIESEFLPQVFDRFRQSERTMTRNYNGLGLGLTIAKAIIDLHGGQIESSSPGVDMGAKFTIRLPISSTTEPRSIKARPQEAVPVASLHGRRILIVDDDSGTRDVLGEFLGSEGATVRVARSGLEALELLSSESFDVLVSDIGMPGMSGLELLERLRANPETAEIQALALTAYQDSSISQLCLQAGFQDYAIKPIGLMELLGKIAVLIQ